MLDSHPMCRTCFSLTSCARVNRSVGIARHACATQYSTAHVLYMFCSSPFLFPPFTSPPPRHLPISLHIRHILLSSIPFSSHLSSTIPCHLPISLPCHLPITLHCHIYSLPHLTLAPSGSLGPDEGSKATPSLPVLVLEFLRGSFSRGSELVTD